LPRLHYLIAETMRARRLGTPRAHRFGRRVSGVEGASFGVLRRMSKGRIGVLDLVGLPSIQVTVSGRKSGIPRTTPLQYVPDGDAFLVVGSNWGGATTRHGRRTSWPQTRSPCGDATNNSSRRSGCSPETSANRPGTKPLTSGPTTRSRTTSPADDN